MFRYRSTVSMYFLRCYVLSKLFNNTQSNLVNSKSSGLEVLFRIICNLNYREVDIKNVLNPQNDHYYFFYQA